jgi:hypothetical protein
LDISSDYFECEMFVVFVLGNVVSIDVLKLLFVYIHLRLLHTMNVRFSLLDIAQRILGVTLPNFQ